MRTADDIRRELDGGANITVLRPKGDADPPTGKGERPDQTRTAALIEPIRFAELADRMPPPRHFIVDEWLPAGCVTSLYGPGGVGKSLLAQQVGTAVAVGRELFGFAVERGPVLGLMCEDDHDELWRRQIRVNEWFACGMGDLDNLHLQGRAGLENTLALYPASGPPTAEALYELIREKARELKPVLIILDPIAQLYGGNENDRFQVSHFINLVGGLAREFDCAVLLLGHPAKADGSEYSGSTAWNASVRSRLLLQRKEGEENELLLSRVKSNYAKPDVLSLHWVNGTLRPTAQKLQSLGDRIEAEAQAAKARTAFLAALDKLTAQGRNVSHSERATNYAPKVMAGLCGDFRPKDLAAAMTELLDRGVIVANAKLWKGSDRKPVHGLARIVDPPDAEGSAGRSDDSGEQSAGGCGAVRCGPPIGGDTPARTFPDTCGTVPSRTSGTFPQPSRTTFPQEEGETQTEPEPRVLFESEEARPVTVISETARGWPTVDRVRLRRLAIGTGMVSTTDVGVGVYWERSGRAGCKPPFASLTRKLPGAFVAVVEGAIDLRLEPPTDEVLWHDRSRLEAVWRDITGQVRSSGRTVLFDGIADALSDALRRAAP